MSFCMPTVLNLQFRPDSPLPCCDVFVLMTLLCLLCLTPSCSATTVDGTNLKTK